MWHFFLLQVAVQNMSGEESKQVVIQLAEIMSLHILPFLTAPSMNLNHQRVDEGCVPGWCKCGHCVQMKNQEERVCCGKPVGSCVTNTQHLLTCA